MRPGLSEIVFNFLHHHFPTATDSRLGRLAGQLQNNGGIGRSSRQHPPIGQKEEEMPTTLLFVDDNLSLVEAASRYLSELRPGWRFLLAHSLSEARWIYNHDFPDVAVLGVTLPDGSGLDLLSEFNLSRPACPIIMTSENCDPDLHRAVKDRGGYALLAKPFSAPVLVNFIRSALSAFRDLSPVLESPQPEASGAWRNPYSLVLRSPHRKLAIYDPDGTNAARYFLK